MARKKAGDLFNILSDPGNREGLVTGPTPVQVTPKASHIHFPGIVGLGAVTGTGVPPMQRRAALAEDDERGGRSFRMDLALAGLLGLLVTNIVSFTLGARAGRQSVDPGTTAAVAPSGPTTPVVEAAKPAPVVPPAALPAPPDAATTPGETGPLTPLSGSVPAAPGAPTVTAPAAPAPAVPAAADDTSDEAMAGKYVVRCITLSYDERGKQIAQRICTFLEGEGFGPALARAARGDLVVEAGRFTRFDDAKAAAAKIRKLRQGYNSFDTAFVIQRTGK
jgi:hypothetical protein